MLEAVLFDFDYTLVDASPGIILCANYALTRMGHAEETAERIRATIGLSLPDAFRWLRGPQEPGAETFARLFVEHADRVMVDHTTLLPAVPGALAALQRRGLRLGIVSTKFRFRIEAVLQRDGLGGAFEAIVGGEDVAQHKPHPESLLLALRKLGQPAGCVYVGDSPTDAHAAQRAGLPFVGVLSGVTPAAGFLPYQPLAVIPDVGGLPELIEQGVIG